MRKAIWRQVTIRGDSGCGSEILWLWTYTRRRAANVMRCLTWHRCYSLYHISVTQPRSQSNPQRPMMGQVSSQSETKRQTTRLLRHCQPSASNYAPLYARLLSIRCRLHRPRLDCTQRRYCRQGRLEMGHNWMMYVRRI